MTSTLAHRRPRGRFPTLAVPLGALLLLGAAAAAAAQQEEEPTGPQVSPLELKALSLEELLEVEVTSVVKRPQRLIDAAAAVSVVTGEDIRRSGVRSLAEALRLAPGVHVGRFDSRTWAVSARGLNITTANKMLVLIDGRSVYTPLFSGVFWDVQAPMLEDVERIEVIRGPAATLWGTNAVNGVINVITRSSGDTQGGLLVAGAGDEERFGALRWGGEAAGGHYRVYGKLDRHGALVFADGTSADDPLRLGQGGFRLDLPAGEASTFTLQGDLYHGRIGHPVRDDTDVDGGHLLGHWSRRLAGGSLLELRGFYDHTFRRVPGQFQEDRDTWDLEGQHAFARGRHDVLWGGGARVSADSVVNSPVLAFEPRRETTRAVNLFVQDEITLAPAWRLVVGTKLEEQSTMELEAMPSLRLAWAPTAGSLAWGGAARAARAPTRLERDSRFLAPGGVPLLVGNPDFEPEVVTSFEVGYRRGGGRGLLLEIVAFHNELERLRSLEPSPAGLPLVFANRVEGDTDGVTVGARWQPIPRLRLHGGLDFLDTELRAAPGGRDVNAGTAEANDPDFHGFVRADLDLPRDLELGLWLRHVDGLPAPVVPAYTELDVRLGWRRRPDLAFALVGQNLLDDHHPEFGAPAGREEVERGLYGQVTWSF